LEAGASIRVAGDVVWQEFQSDEAMQPGILGFVNDDAHAASAELFQDAEVEMVSLSMGPAHGRDG